METAPLTTIGFRELTRDDFDLLKSWLESNAVKEWWHEPTDTKSLKKKYGPRIDKLSATHSYVVLAELVPIGMMQAYRVDDYPDYSKAVNLDKAVAFDWFIGNEAYVGRGLGTRIALKFSTDVIVQNFPDVTFVVTSPSVKNTRSIHVLEKAGFENRGTITVPGEPDPQMLLALPTTHN